VASWSKEIIWHVETCCRVSITRLAQCWVMQETDWLNKICACAESQTCWSFDSFKLMNTVPHYISEYYSTLESAGRLPFGKNSKQIFLWAKVCQAKCKWWTQQLWQTDIRADEYGAALLLDTCKHRPMSHHINIQYTMLVYSHHQHNSVSSTKWCNMLPNGRW